MRLQIDSDACTGHGRCYALAPELFDADDQGHCVIRLDGGDDSAVVPAELEGAARTGADNCPEGALTIEG